jgi:LytS/YehU family sensor histidine kinase
VADWVVPVAKHLALAIALSCLTKLAWDLGMFHALAFRPLYLSKGWTLDNVLRSLNGALDIGLTAYALVVISCFAADYYQRYLNKQREALELERELAQAELRALKMQLHPHFLFNTLHAISALVADAPKEAEQMIVRLSEMLRLSLDNSGAQEVSLDQEIRFLNLYLDIERMRFAERLTVTMNIEPGALEAAVPNLILQPLVENSIRHGIERVSRPGRIEVSAARLDGHLVLSVMDNGAGLPQDQMPPERYGVGLRATRGRLERLYGPAQSLVLRRPAAGGVEAVVTIPFRLSRSAPEEPKAKSMGAKSG